MQYQEEEGEIYAESEPTSLHTHMVTPLIHALHPDLVRDEILGL